MTESSKVRKGIQYVGHVMHKARTGIKVYDNKLRLEQRHFMSSFALLRVWSFQGSFFFSLWKNY